MEIWLERGTPVVCRNLSLPAELYRRIRHQLARQRGRCAFIPIRSLQYLAVIDDEEVVFVDGMVKHRIEIAWRRFQPHRCARLGDPVPFEECRYSPQLDPLAARLRGEFGQALAQHELRHPGSSPAPGDVVPLIPRKGQDRP